MNNKSSLAINTVLPSTPKLKKHIAYYYFLKGGNQKTPVEFSYYPHYYSTLNFFKHGEIVIKGATRYVFHNKQKAYTSVFSRNTKSVKSSLLEGPYNVIGVVFKPLGINHFVIQKLHNQFQEYIFEALGITLHTYLDNIFDKAVFSQKAQLLDEFFSHNYNEFKAPILKDAVAKILACKGDINLTELSAFCDVNRRTLLRHFKDHLGYSFRDFKAVVKFRTALNQGIQKGQLNKLSDLAYDANYYDQSDFIKQFKVKSKETPKQMLKTVTQVTDQLLWKIP